VTFFFIGRLTFTHFTHVGTSIDRQIVTAEQSKLTLELAEQNQRFSIARDITDLIIQRISTVLTLAQGGNYASKVDPAAGGRALERLEETAREAHLELRRLYDMLNRSQSVSSAPPGIENLESLLLEFRQLGYSITLRHVGDQFELSEGANLAVYRIVFEALENIRENAVVGSDIAVDFMWANDGLQVLIKDNGIETSNRMASAKDPNFVSDYTATDDLKALVDPISGVGITAMRDRAALYGGTVEAHLVPGVGFTLSAMFPMMRTLGGLSRSEG
jgi:signal transduction histidine kinase